MPEYITVYLDVATEFAERQKRVEINRLNGEGWLPDEFYGENGVNIVDDVVFHHFVRYSEAERQDTLNNKKNAEVLLEQNPDSTEESYKITALCAYWPSHSETAFVVEAAAPTPTTQPAIVLPPTEMYVLGIGIAIIVAVAIVGALLALMIRKRP